MLSTRKQAYSTVLEITGQKMSSQLPVPTTLPDQYYVSTHHLNSEGCEKIYQNTIPGYKK